MRIDDDAAVIEQVESGSEHVPDLVLGLGGVDVPGEGEEVSPEAFVGVEELQCGFHISLEQGSLEAAQPGLEQQLVVMLWSSSHDIV